MYTNCAFTPQAARASKFALAKNVVLLETTFEEINSIPAEKQSVPLALKCLGTNVVGTKVYRTSFSGILSSGGILRSDWSLP